MGDVNNTPEAAVIDSGGTIHDAAAYQAAATLASLISAPISSSDSNEMTRNAPLRPHSRYNETKKPIGKYVISHDNRSTNGTRKFTRDDDVNLIRGILKYGKSSWKKIWQETPQLQHIKHAALKDRGRSRRFQNALEQASKDPSLLDRPYELLGDAQSSWYEKDSSETGAGATKRSAGVIKSEGNANKRSKLTNTATPKPRTYNKGLKNLQNGEVDVFPGWNFECFQRKNSTQYERLWSHKSLDGISVRSRVGMREMMEKMETHRVDAKGAYEILMSEGKGKYFMRTGNKNGQEDDFPGWTCVQARKNNSTHYERIWSHKTLVGVCVKSRVGMREMVEKMETHRIDAKGAYERLMIEGKSKYFIRAGSKFCGKIVAANGSLVDVEEWNRK